MFVHELLMKGKFNNKRSTHNFACLRLFPPSTAFADILHRTVTFDVANKDLFAEFEESIFQNRTSHTCQAVPEMNT